MRANPLLAFYGELVERVARLAAEWMAAGFVRGVLNTDTMSLVGESFDYGPFAFLDRWDPGFTAAYFDHSGLYAFGRQPLICHHNLQRLQVPLAMLLPRRQLEGMMERFAPTYDAHAQWSMRRRLGLEPEGTTTVDLADPVSLTLQLLTRWDVGYGAFFSGLAHRVRRGGWPETSEELEPFMAGCPLPERTAWLSWRDAWWAGSRATALGSRDAGSAEPASAVQRWNLLETPTRPVIERLWEAIDRRDDWQALQDWLLRNSLSPSSHEGRASAAPCG